MTDRIDQRTRIADALNDFGASPLPDAARGLFGVLGYQSNRTIPISTPKQFCEQLDPGSKLTDRERESLRQLQSLTMLFQLTDAEFSPQQDLFDDGTAVESTQIHSYLFFAAELPPGHYTRTKLSTLVRAVNKPLPMPALVLFQHGDTVSIGIIHRRLHKRDRSKDVLEKVTLIKDIACDDPIRAHLEILNDFALANLDADFGVSNFVRLHEAWQKRLGSYALSNDFYREIADWYFWAHHQVQDGTIRLPQHCDTEQEQSLFLIRLLTRVIFCWFLVEKRLIPAGLFRDHQLKALLKDFQPGKTPDTPDTSPTYYHAVLQNLFFGTLNMPPEQRGFREKKKKGQRYDKNYGITNLWRYESDFRDPQDWIKLAALIPFLNGGLFDCLDDKTGKKQDNTILDGFSDNPRLTCHLPNDLFFGKERVVDLSRDYGEEKSKTARSKKAKVRGLIEILSRYKFTVEENTPLEEEIALDPELLGKVFENLLASYNEDTRTTARKALGAFYTPREIVNYMVDESLKSYLAGQVPRCKGALGDLFSNKATLRDIKPATRDALIAAIGRVKILDPACGSGAFPMGALHRLVDLLQKLDPNNESWKRDRLAEARRYHQVLEEAGATKEETEACEGRITDIEKSFDTRYHALDFARKLYLIENCIYGVDIQPIATQIAKLRFFISLIVDQKLSSDAPNLGVRPLPNLETRIVAADTLIPIEKEETDLFSGELDKLRAELAAIRHEHFNARSPAAKRKWRDADEAKRREIAELLVDQHTLPTESAQQLAAWDPYDQNTFAPFFDPEWMFGLPVGKVRIHKQSNAALRGNFAFVNELAGQKELVADKVQEIDSGFDVVIGNPPYVRIQTLKKKDPELVAFFKRHYASAAKGNYDLYVVFIEAGLNLLKSDGHLAYICPHKFFNAKYGEPLRALIAKGSHLRHVVHFGDEQVFPGATNYVCLLFLDNRATDSCSFVRANDFAAWLITLQGAERRFPAKSISSSQWNFVVGRGANIFERLQAMPQKLGDVASIFVGLQTSADRIFVLKGMRSANAGTVTVQSRDGSEWRIESTYLKPFLSDVSLAPFKSPVAKHWLIFPYSIGDGAVQVSASTVRKECPNLWRYLKQNERELRSRESGKADGPDWHAYIYRKNLSLFDEPKLIVQVLAQSPRFAFDSQNLYFTGGGNGPYYGVRWAQSFAKRPLKFLQALLNSRVSDFYIRHVSTTFHGGYWSYGKRFIEQIPIASNTAQQERELVRLVNYLLWLNRHFADHEPSMTNRDPLMLAYWEQILNGLVYELYFPEEVHGTGLRMFDLVEQAGLPDIDSIPEPQRLPSLREKFEDLYEGDHPLRIALDKLQTLDTVRIIEGKA